MHFQDNIYGQATDKLGEMLGNVGNLLLLNITSHVDESISRVGRDIKKDISGLRCDVSDVKGDISDTKQEIQTDMKTKHDEMIKELKLGTNITELEITFSDPVLSKHKDLLVNYLSIDEELLNNLTAEGLIIVEEKGVVLNDLQTTLQGAVKRLLYYVNKHINNNTEVFIECLAENTKNLFICDILRKTYQELTE
jgi:hypothetical protein